MLVLMQICSEMEMDASVVVVDKAGSGCSGSIGRLAEKGFAT